MREASKLGFSAALTPSGASGLVPGVRATEIARLSDLVTRIQTGSWETA
jgi:hypothetical protein